MTPAQSSETDIASELVASRERYRALLQSALDCVVAMDHRGHVLEWNAAAERTFGLSADEAVGHDMAELIVPPSLRPRHRDGLARYLRGGAAVVLDRRIEITAMRATGDEFPCELTITHIDQPGDPVFVGYLRDITDRHAAERELRESRARLVRAQYEARQRIERDLHDGAQQHLVGLALTLRLARSKVSDDADLARELIDEAIADLATATGELRELARGIHPAVLTEGGLEPALAGLAGRVPVPVRIDCELAERPPAAVESTAYFVIAEALTNVARYAEAERADVHVSLDGGWLVVEVRDNGRGGADASVGSGLRGLADRVSAFEGRFSVNSPPGRGTTLRAELPCA